MRLAEPNWAIQTRDGAIVATLYHLDNCYPEARYQARKLGEPVDVVPLRTAAELADHYGVDLDAVIRLQNAYMGRR